MSLQTVKTDNLSTLWIKPCMSPPDITVAQPYSRGRPPTDHPRAPSPQTVSPAHCRRRVTFAYPAATVIQPAPQRCGTVTIFYCSGSVSDF
jgi:hypothetical protein